MNVRRAARGIGRARHRHARVGDAAPAPSSSSPPGFVTVFPGWNVWVLWRSDDPDRGILGTIWNLGMAPDTELRVWVEDQIKDNAHGAAVADPLNPAALRGAQIQIIPSANGLKVDATRADIPELAGAVQLGKSGSKASRVFVRFYNRGEQSVMPWPHDENVLLDNSFVPSKTNSLTNGPAPGSLAGTATNIANEAESVVKVIAIGGGVVLAAVLVIALANTSRKVAA
jgi:hypothetical protein